MDVVSYQSKPELRRPVIVAAFRGFSDAGEASSLALGYLHKAWKATPFASIDPEEFFDFTVARPHIRLGGKKGRRIVWPTTAFAHAKLVERDAVLLAGIEPSTRWRTFCRAVLEVATECRAELLVTLGAFGAEVPHSRPVSVIGTSNDPELAGRLRLATSQYEGPIGIVGVLHDACGTAGLPSLSLWAQIPDYANQIPSPKAALELVKRLGTLLEVTTKVEELETSAREYETRVDEAVRSEPEMARYVEELERRADEETEDIGDTIAEEVQRFLRSLREDET